MGRYPRPVVLWKDNFETCSSERLPGNRAPGSCYSGLLVNAPFLTLPTSSLLPPGISSEINYLHMNPCLRLCFQENSNQHSLSSWELLGRGVAGQSGMEQLIGESPAPYVSAKTSPSHHPQAPGCPELLQSCPLFPSSGSLRPNSSFLSLCHAM